MSRAPLNCGQLSKLILHTIVIHMVDKEQRQTLDAHLEEFPFLMDMRQDGLANLMATHIDVIHTSYHLTFVQYRSIQQTDGMGIAINAFHAIAILVFLQAATLLIDIKAVAHQLCYLLHTTCAFLIETNTSLRISLTQFDAFQIQIAIGGCGT